MSHLMKETLDKAVLNSASARVKEMMTKEIQTEWIMRQEQVADCLTKAEPNLIF